MLNRQYIESSMSLFPSYRWISFGRKPRGQLANLDLPGTQPLTEVLTCGNPQINDYKICNFGRKINSFTRVDVAGEYNS